MILMTLVHAAVFSLVLSAHGADLTATPSASCPDQVAAGLTFAERVRIKRFLVTFAVSSMPNVDAPHVLRSAFIKVGHAALPKPEWSIIEANLEAIGFESKDWHRSHLDPSAIARLRAGWGVFVRAALRAEGHIEDPLADKTFGRLDRLMLGHPAPKIETREANSIVIPRRPLSPLTTLERRDHQRVLNFLSVHGKIESIKAPGALNEAYRALLTHVTPPDERSPVMDALEAIDLQPLDAVNAYNRVKARRRLPRRGCCSSASLISRRTAITLEAR